MIDELRGLWEHRNNGIVYGQCADDDDEAHFICDCASEAVLGASREEMRCADFIAADPKMFKDLETIEQYLSYGQYKECERIALEAIAAARGKS